MQSMSAGIGREDEGEKGKTDERVPIFISSQNQYQRIEIIKPGKSKHPTSYGIPQ